ncbi:MAG: mannonate dehydratase, partial [Enterococcus sp.]|nr:mannonate dehydratase [Enterococcus sp.]
MKMTLRWFGENEDSVKLEQIRQIPGVEGVITALHHIPAGEVWPLEEIIKLKEKVESKGLKLVGIESVNVHEDIKIGLPSREKYIENYKETLANLGKVGIDLVCYNFMPIFDWTRTELARELPDGSYVLSYDENVIRGIKPEEMFERIENSSDGFLMPGWESNRKSEIMELF